MTKYQLPDGNIVIADADFIAAHHPGAVPDLVPDPPAPVFTRLTKLGFRSRFTAPEKTAIELALFNQCNLHGFLVGKFLDDDWHFFQSQQICSSPTPFSGNNLIGHPVWTNQNRLQHPILSDGIRQS